MYSFPDLELVYCSMCSSNCCFLTCVQIPQEAGQVVWYSHLFQNFPQFIVIHTVKGFGIVNKAEIDVFLELSWLPWWLTGKESTCDAGDPDSIPELGRSPGGGHSSPLQYSCLENPMHRRGW